MCQSVYYADKGKSPQPTLTVVTDFKMCNSACILPKMKTAPTTDTLFLNDISMTFVNWISSVQSLSRVQLFVTPWIAAHQSSLSSPTPGVHPDSCPLSRWCHPAISSSVVPFSSCPQSLPAYFTNLRIVDKVLDWKLLNFLNFNFFICKNEYG